MALSEFAGSLLTNHHQQILGVGKEIEKLDATSLHALRISIKKQRYAMEFFQTLYSPEKVKKYIRSLSELQDILGAINDSANTQKLLEEIPSSKTKALMSREAIGIIVGWNRLHLEQKKEELKRTLLPFYDTPLFWEVY
jgi:CHAD domain-containing protein